MKIYIELVIIFALMLMFIIWKIWFDRSRKKILKKYKPEMNESREHTAEHNGNNQKGGIFGSIEQRTTTGTTEPRVEPTPVSSIGSEQSERSELLQKADVDDVGENSSSTGKDSSNVRSRFFRRNKRK